MVYCSCHTGVLHMPSCASVASQVYYRDKHVQYIRSPTWVYCICNQVYCIFYHVHQKPHLGVLHLSAFALDLPSSVLQRPSCTSGATLGCTTLAIKCYAEAMLYFKSPTWVYQSCQVILNTSNLLLK